MASVWLLALAAMLAACEVGSSPAVDDVSPPPLLTAKPAKQLIIGQDLGSIRGYMASDCCPRPDGLTAYLDLYDLLKDDDFGGLGIDASGHDADLEFEWGSGPISAFRTATEFGINSLALGLSITENEHPGKLQLLISGEYDAHIRQLARFAGMIEGPVYLRIGYEFDGAWNQGYQDPDTYIGAYRRIVDTLRAEGVENIEMVWQASTSTTDDVIDGGHEDITRWYPGDDYVDWMGLSWFMNPHETVQVPSNYTPQTPLQLTEELLAFARQRGKPVMVAEAAPQGLDLDENFTAHHVGLWDGPAGEGRKSMTDNEIWDFWFAPLFELLEQNRDVVHILAYINADWDSQPMWGPPYDSGFWGDTRLEVNDDIAARFTDAINQWKSPQ